jgi:hypothetical protein
MSTPPQRALARSLQRLFFVAIDNAASVAEARHRFIWKTAPPGNRSRSRSAAFCRGA